MQQSLVQNLSGSETGDLFVNTDHVEIRGLISACTTIDKLRGTASLTYTLHDSEHGMQTVVLGAQAQVGVPEELHSRGHGGDKNRRHVEDPVGEFGWKGSGGTHIRHLHGISRGSGGRVVTDKIRRCEGGLPCFQIAAVRPVTIFFCQ